MQLSVHLEMGTSLVCWFHLVIPLELHLNFSRIDASICVIVNDYYFSVSFVGIHRRIHAPQT